jgi:hypothetical protein
MARIPGQHIRNGKQLALGAVAPELVPGERATRDPLPVLMLQMF